jgi:hypothetical protein
MVEGGSERVVSDVWSLKAVRSCFLPHRSESFPILLTVLFLSAGDPMIWLNPVG